MGVAAVTIRSKASMRSSRVPRVARTTPTPEPMLRSLVEVDASTAMPAPPELLVRVHSILRAARSKPWMPTPSGASLPHV